MRPSNGRRICKGLKHLAFAKCISEEIREKREGATTNATKLWLGPVVSYRAEVDDGNSSAFQGETREDYVIVHRYMINHSHPIKGRAALIDRSA